MSEGLVARRTIRLYPWRPGGEGAGLCQSLAAQPLEEMVKRTIYDLDTVLSALVGLSLKFSRSKPQ